MSRQLHDDSADSSTFREGTFHNVDAGSQWSPLRKRGAGVIGRSLSAGRLPSPMAVKRHTDIACGARSRGCCADSSRTGLVRPILRAASGVSLADDAIANSKHPNSRGGWSRRARLGAGGCPISALIRSRRDTSRQAAFWTPLRNLELARRPDLQIANAARLLKRGPRIPAEPALRFIPSAGAPAPRQSPARRARSPARTGKRWGSRIFQ